MSPGEAPGDGVVHLLEDAVRRGITPGAVALVAEADRVLQVVAVGEAQVVPVRRPMAKDTVFDLASLTKPLVTAAMALMLERELGLDPERQVRSLLPELDRRDHAEITLRHLLTHSAGLAAWRPLFLGAETAPGFLEVLRDEPLVGRPGEQALYSDPGYIAAGEAVARAAGTGLDALFRELLAGPLELGARFRPGPDLAARCAATEVGQEYERSLAGERGQGYHRWRSAAIRGEVHDHHAWIAGGILGTAGLFATAADVHRLALECLGQGQGLLPPRAVERLRAPLPPLPGEARSEGFALNTGGKGSCGPSLPESAFGHTGFTGTSLWIDPVSRRIYVLLTNRIHPRVQGDEMPGLRREFHRLAARIPA